MGYLLGGLGLLAMALFTIPGIVVVPTVEVRVGLVIALLLGAGALWWAIRRFTQLGERVVAVVGVVVGWYMLLALINGIMIFTSL